MKMLIITDAGNTLDQLDVISLPRIGELIILRNKMLKVKNVIYDYDIKCTNIVVELT